ncbi:probable basic-leucine zipper transcription factor Q [Centruroides sculpturatus]|uniref:probable basic-leucine zipper transcription factor Q n=1 Tax=Centruroides sculpturatus TaxID=218467 RepID=UPI000C6E02C8|nr:probable basic-leucine zipper transcription factor Q [Centruroides sculpturatus]
MSDAITFVSNEEWINRLCQLENIDIGSLSNQLEPLFCDILDPVLPDFNNDNALDPISSCFNGDSQLELTKSQQNFCNSFSSTPANDLELNSDHSNIQNNVEKTSSTSLNNNGGKPYVVKLIKKSTSNTLKFERSNAKRVLKIVSPPKYMPLNKPGVDIKKMTGNAQSRKRTEEFKDKEERRKSTSGSQSNDSDDGNGRCMSKNAIAARENREKKKKYLKDLEESCVSFASEIGSLKAENATLREEIKNLHKEVEYLKNVIANSEQLGILIKGVQTIPGLKWNSPVKRKESGDSSNNLTVCKKQKLNADCNDAQNVIEEKTEQKKQTSAICIHVRNRKVSLELCHYCNEKVENNV